MARKNDKKLAAARQYARGVAPEAACKAAGYARPERVAQRLFEVDSNGELVDEVVRATVEHEASKAVDDTTDLAELPVSTLKGLLTDPHVAAHVKQRAAATLNSIMTTKHRKLTHGECCPVCRQVYHDPDVEALSIAERVRARLGIDGPSYLD